MWKLIMKTIWKAIEAMLKACVSLERLLHKHNTLTIQYITPGVKAMFTSISDACLNTTISASVTSGVATPWIAERSWSNKESAFSTSGGSSEVTIKPLIPK
ncbi:hypothetical protein J6590_028312 [Homalodisca vitripennis]|nr:hypothetical protein J6590_028312 [Homalodisca vitripennis]